MLADLDPAPTYPDIEQNWNRDAVCWVSSTSEASWKWNLPATSSAGIQWIRQNTSATLQKLIREELIREGYTVKSFEHEYLTREKRLGLNKLIYFEEFEINKIMVQEGACYDMILKIKITDTPDTTQSQQFEIPGRSVILGDETKLWVEIFNDCVSNMKNIRDIRQALEIKLSS